MFQIDWAIYSRVDFIQLNYHMGLRYKEIRDLLSTVHDNDVCLITVKRCLKAIGLGRRTNYCNLQDAVSFKDSELQGSGMLNGYRWMHSKCIQAGLNITRETVRIILSILDPHGVELRSRRRLVRIRYRSSGPNYVWQLHGYDKLKPYGLAIHGCIDGFSRRVQWLRVHSTNNDPFVVAVFFIETILCIGDCPYRVRSDFGTENGNIEVIQRVLRNDSPGCMMYGTSALNQRIESWWAILRRECIQFWVEVFYELKENGIFTGNWLNKNTIRFCFLELIQVCRPTIHFHC